MPWELSKGQDNFCPISELIDKEVNPYSVELEMIVKISLFRSMARPGRKISQETCISRSMSSLVTSVSM